jgi:spermidine synthase
MWEQPELQQKFDIIIDDGLHLVHSNKCFFENSIHKLNSGGIYIIEDVHDEFLYIFNNIIDEWKSIYTSYTFKIIKLETSHKLVNNNIIFIRT